MERKVVLSDYARVITVVCTVIMCAALWYSYPEKNLFYILAAVVLLALLSTIWYAPAAISADKDAVCVHRLLRKTVIPADEISSVKPLQPTIGAKRICGSGGVMGYWGWFSEKDTGRYFAYYGKASDCFMITLRNGRKYLLGCADSASMTEYINQAINHK